MVECPECFYRHVEVVSSNPYGSEVTVECDNCGEIFEVSKQDIEDETPFD